MSDEIDIPDSDVGKVVVVVEGSGVEAAAAGGAVAAAEPIAAGAGSIAFGAVAGGVEAAAEAEALIGGGLMLGAVGGAAIAGVAVVGATIVLGAMCIAHALPVCKKRVCVDPEGRWHSHQSHCQASNGCFDPNHKWHRHQKHCDNKICQGPDGWWHHNEHHCHVYGCLDPNRDWHEHWKLCNPKHFKCQGPGGRWHKHKRNCHPSKRDAISERDAAFANADLLNVDNSYIVITNADQFNAADLEVLKNMVILPDNDSDYASFENGEQFCAEGEMTKVQPSAGIHTGNFSFPYPNMDTPVMGKWLTADPSSGDPKAQQVLEGIQAAKEKAANAQEAE